MDNRNLIEQIRNIQREIVSRANAIDKLNPNSLEMREWEILNDAQKGLVKLNLFLRGEEVE